MAVTPTYDGATPTVDADEDTWGGELNTALGQIKTDLDALAGQGNSTETSNAGKVAKAGDTMTGELKLGDFGPTSSDSAGLRGAPIVEFNTNKTLVLTDAGKAQCLTGSTGRDLTIPPVGSVGFPVGTIIPVYADSAALAIKRGSGVTLKLAGTATNKDCVVSSAGFGSLFHRSANVWVLSGTGVA